MIIEKKEIIHFSEYELQCIDMTVRLMETLVNNANNPDLVKSAQAVYYALGEIYNYREEEE